MRRFLLLLPLLALALAACQGHKVQASAAAKPAAAGARGKPASFGGGFGRGGFAITVQVSPVKVGPLASLHSAPGSVVAVTQSDVAPQVSGVVQSVLLRPGAQVAQGQAVVQLDPSSLQIALSNAQLALHNAQISLQTNQQNTQEAAASLRNQVAADQASVASAHAALHSARVVYRLGGTSQAQLITAQSQLSSAQASLVSAQNSLAQNQRAGTQALAQLQIAVQQDQNAVRQAQLNLSYATVRAPFAGQVASIPLNPGEFASTGSTAFVLTGRRRQVSFSVPPSDAAALAVGRTVSFEASGQKYPAVINQPPTAPSGGVVPLTAQLRGSSLPPIGTVGTVRYQLTLATGDLIPISTLQVTGNQLYVFTVVKGKIVQDPITVLAESGVTAAVTGLRAGDQVVISPPPGLLAGDTVKVLGAK